MEAGRRIAIGQRSPNAATQAVQRFAAGLRARWELWPILGVALALTAVYYQAAPGLGLPFDDSYISLQFARNLARYGFLTFDGETASAGATSLLHVALLAVPIKLGADPVRASVGLGVLLHLALVAAVYWLGWAIFRDRLVAALSAASAAVTGYLVFDALNGMETTLFLLVSACTAGALFSAKSERGMLLAGAFGALAVLSRPEGVLLLGAMVLYEVLHPERPALRSPAALRRLTLLVAPSVAALIGLVAFYWASTGTPTPGTATAKLLFFREFEASFQTKFDRIDGGVANFVAPVLPWLALTAFSVRRRETLLYAFFWVAFIVLYYFLLPGGVSHYWYRYQHAFLVPIVVSGSAGAVALVRSLPRRGWDLLAATAIGLVLLAGVAFQYNAFRNHYANDVGLNETRQVDLALYLRDVVPPGGTVATHDIGAIGYYSERTVIDLVGLIDPDVTRYHSGRHLREYVDQVQPDYIVVFPSWEDYFLHLGLKDDPALFEPVMLFGGGPNREPFVVYKTHYQDR